VLPARSPPWRSVSGRSSTRKAHCAAQEEVGVQHQKGPGKCAEAKLTSRNAPARALILPFVRPPPQSAVTLKVVRSRLTTKKSLNERHSRERTARLSGQTIISPSPPSIPKGTWRKTTVASRSTRSDRVSIPADPLGLHRSLAVLRVQPALYYLSVLGSTRECGRIVVVARERTICSNRCAAEHRNEPQNHSLRGGKSLTSAWRHSMFSTMKKLERSGVA
jgi:hypothetical protein